MLVCLCVYLLAKAHVARAHSANLQSSDEMSTIMIHGIKIDRILLLYVQKSFETRVRRIFNEMKIK